VSLTRKPRAKDIYNYLLGQGDPRLNPLARTEVSAFVVCKNEERNIRRCLSSLAWCDEIVLVDSGSTDKTLDIAREFTDKIYFREWTGHSEQKQFALEKCTKEWVLNIDADEEVSPELRGHIEQVLSRPDDTRRRVSGYEVNRLVYFLNKWWEHGGWYPEYRLRFFQREKARWGGVNPHEKAVVRGRVRRIHGHLHHFTYQDIPHQIRSLNDHSTLSARCLHQEGVKVHLWNILLNPPFRFVKFYILKRGFREGFPGFMVAFIEAMYTFLKYVKLWELQRLGSGQSVQSSYRSAHRYEQASQGVK
jgi:glycosyltransferase involved in cell wall biosynthesis